MSRECGREQQQGLSLWPGSGTKGIRESPGFLPLSHQAPRANMVPEGIRLNLSPQLVFPGNNLTDTLEVCIMVTWVILGTFKLAMKSGHHKRSPDLNGLQAPSSFVFEVSAPPGLLTSFSLPFNLLNLTNFM